MHFDDGAVQADRIDLDTHDLSMLQAFKDSIEHPRLRPAVHAGVDGVPVAKTLRQSAPLATMLCHVQDRIDYAQIRMTDIATLLGQAVFDLAVLLFADFHARIMPYVYASVQHSVNTP